MSRANAITVSKSALEVAHSSTSKTAFFILLLMLDKTMNS